MGAAGEMPDPWSLAAEPIPPPVAGAGHPEAEQEVYASIQLWGARSDPGKGGSGKKRQIRWQLGGRGTWKPNRRTKWRGLLPVAVEDQMSATAAGSGTGRSPQ